MTRLKILGLAAFAAGALFLNGCKGCQNQVSYFKSGIFGLNRVVTLYGVDGHVIKTWSGNFNVEDQGGTIRFLDERGKAITISGTFTIEEQ